MFQYNLSNLKSKFFQVISLTLVIIIHQPVMLGLNQSVLIVSSQYIGAKKYKLAYNYLEISILISFIWFSISLIFLIFLFPFLSSQTWIDKKSIDQSALYIFPNLFSGLMGGIFGNIKSYMISNEILQPFQHIQFGGLIMYIISVQIFMNRLQLIHSGFTLSVALGEFTNILLIGIYLKQNKPFQSHHYPNFKEILNRKRIKFMINFSAPITMQYFTTFLFVSVISLISASFGPLINSAYGILSNLSSLNFRFTMSLTQLLISYIGKALGEKNIESVSYIIKVGLIYFHLWTLPYILMIYFGFYYWIDFYTDQMDVIVEVQNCLFVFSFLHLYLDGFQNFWNGILRALEERNFISKLFTTCFFFLGLPIIFLLSLHLNFKVKGLFIGFSLVNFTVTFISIFKYSRIQFQDVAQITQNRIKQEIQIVFQNNMKTLKSIK